MTLQEYLKSLSGKKITVIGAGVSNRPLIALLCDAGHSVTVCDKASPEALGAFYTEYAAKGVNFSLGESYLDHLDADIIFRTPGLYPGVPALVKAREAGTLVTSEMEVFCRLCPCRIYAITGSDGKTTTTTLISELLKTTGKTVWLGGNIGHPLLAEVDSMKADDYAVLELSSFQLHSMMCSPAVAVITNISPNHLDVHPDYQDYIDAKKQVFKNQAEGARLVLNLNNDVTAKCAAETNSDVRWFSRLQKVEKGAYLRDDGMICLTDGSKDIPVLPAEEIRIPGNHNIENMMTAFAAVEGVVSVEAMARTAREFKGVEHRLETVRVLHGVTYINDSIASSPNRTIAGLSCFKDKVILIAGGKDKGIPLDALGDAVCEHVKRLYLTGWTAEKIRDVVLACDKYEPGKPEVHVIDDFADTVRAAAAAAQDGDIVILSPACTSFDRFKNFMERGNTFRRIVEELE